MKRYLFFLPAITFFTITCFSQEIQSSNFKSDLNLTDVRAVLKSVADWQVNTPLTHPLGDWTNGALYAGMVEWAGISGDKKYFDWLKDIGVKNNWSISVRKPPVGRYHADDYCVGQSYIELYRKYKDKNMIKALRANLDSIMANPANGDLIFVTTKEYSSQERWSWCDALFMAPTVWAKMGNITGNRKYYDFMYHEYKFTTDYLFDKDEDLFFRDSGYFTKKENNGAKVFWGRGNGWVFGGLPIIIRELPKKYDQKIYFISLFKEMAAKLLKLQDPDGYWHASLLDPASFPNPEMSGTAFFVFGFAWGIDNGYLDKETYLPAVKKGWKAMVNCVWPDGKVGFIQPVGADPKATTREMTEVYGVGGFLLAGTEITRLIQNGILK